ncbi:TetR/AcrR family transcriptional regulator [Nocardia asteroides]|uniref:TetR/AcrR family transcriptional regulator n=1 Tax=Nocardia asteroides TaxID=1824 RepID=UPI00379E543B
MTPAPSAANRRAARRSARREQLTDAARLAFSRYGYHATTMATICDYAQISKPVGYRHFTNKLEVYLEVVQRYLDDTAATLRAAIDPDAAASENTRRVVEVFFDLVESDHYATHDLVFNPTVLGDPAAERRITTALGEFTTVVHDCLGRASADPDRVRLHTMGLIGATLTSAGEWHRARKPIPEHEALALIAAWYRAGAPEQADAFAVC